MCIASKRIWFGDKKWSESLVADKLSRLEHGDLRKLVDINEVLFDKQILNLEDAPWYAVIMNYLAKFIIPPDYSSHQKKKLFSNLKYCFLEDYILYKWGPNQIIRRCFPK